MTKQNFIIYIFLLLPFFGFSQELTEAEYFIDTDPGFGNGTAVAIPANDGAADLSFQADLTGVSNGVHILYVRVKDDNGVWSLTGYRPFYYNQASGNAAPDIAAVEYFIDEDPGFGNGTAVSVNANSGAVAVDFDADLAGVSNGVHILYVRTKDANGLWSLTGYRPFYYNAATGQLRDITAMEYFWDEDPGFGSGIPIEFNQPGNVVVEDVNLDYSFLIPGEHRYYIRVLDEGGVWSLTANGTFLVPCEYLTEVAFYEAGTDILVSTGTFITSFDGVLSINFTGDPGTYDLFVSPARHLSSELDGVELAPGETTELELNAFLAGDIDGNNIIGNGDLNQLFNSWEAPISAPNFDLNSNLNCDDQIGNGDLNQLFNNWEIIGLPSPE